MLPAIKFIFSDFGYGRTVKKTLSNKGRKVFYRRRLLDA